MTSGLSDGSGARLSAWVSGGLSSLFISCLASQLRGGRQDGWLGGRKCHLHPHRVVHPSCLGLPTKFPYLGFGFTVHH